MKVLDHPRAGKIVLGGCHAPDPHAPMLRLRDYLVEGAPLPQPPAEADWTGPAMSVLKNIEGNDTLGDCVIAEDAHYIAVITGNANTLYPYTRAQTVADYSAIAGYVPGNPNTDQGTDPIACMNYRVKVGYKDGSKDLGYLQVDATNQEEVRFAIWAFGNVKLWLALPDSYVNPFPSGDGFVWDADTPDPQNGHCIGGYGYDPRAVNAVAVTAQGVVIDTWGDLGILTWAALAKLCVPAVGGGCATRVNMDWLGKASMKTPSGFDWVSLIQDFDTMGGTIPVPPSPPPPPPAPPPPSPTGAPTLAQAQAAVHAALAHQWYLVPKATAQALVDAALAKLWPAS